MAVQAIMARDAGAAIGDFARTSDGAANQQRILDANMQNLQATLGQGLLPLYGAFIGTLNQLVQRVMPPVSAFITERVVPAMESIGAVIRDNVQPMIETAMAWFNDLGTTMRTQTDGPFAYLRRWFDENMPRIQQIVDTVVSALTKFWADHGETITKTIGDLVDWVLRLWDTQFRTILDIVTGILQLLTGDFEGAGQTLRGAVNRWWDFLRDAVTAVINNVRNAWNGIDWGGIGRGVLDGIANGIRNGAGRIADAARQAAQNALDAAKNMLGIRSPSRVAAEQVGEPFAAGIADGIRTSLATMAGGVNAGLQGLMSGIQTPAATGGIGGGVFNITINVSGGDAAAVGAGARDGVLSALRSAGIR
jgi:phage-related protein